MFCIDCPLKPEIGVKMPEAVNTENKEAFEKLHNNHSQHCGSLSTRKMAIN